MPLDDLENVQSAYKPKPFKPFDSISPLELKILGDWLCAIGSALHAIGEMQELEDKHRKPFIKKEIKDI